MSARILDIADAIVDAIEGGAWTIGAVNPTRRYTTEYEISELSTLRVDVQPIDQADTVDDREEGQRTEYVLQITVQKRVKPTDNAQVDPLLNLTRELSDYFHEGRLITVTTEMEIVEAKTVLYSPKEFDVNKRYFGTVMLKFGEWTG